MSEAASVQMLNVQINGVWHQLAIVRNYLKATHRADGLLLNFSAMPLTVKRVPHERALSAPDLHS